MTRDPDLLRKLLLWAEEIDPDDRRFHEVEIEGYTPGTVREHVKLLEESGFVEAIFTHDPLPVIKRLTWHGHDYLASIKDDSVWAKVRSQLATFGSEVPLSVIKELGVAYIKDRLGLGEGG